MSRNFKSIITICVMLAAFVFIGAAVFDGGNTVYGAESGTCDVYDGTTKIQTSMNIREAWNLCIWNYDYKIVLTSDVLLDKKLATRGLAYENEIAFDLNGYSIDCQNKDGAFKLHKYDTIRIYNSKYGTKDSTIKNCDNSAILSYGVLYVEGIDFYNCSGANGGAICVIAARDDLTSLNDPHAEITNCTIRNCSGEMGGGIYSTIVKLGVDGEIPDQYEEIDEYIESNEGFGAVLNIRNTEISGCTAQYAGSGLGLGGGINFQGKCIIQESSIENCYAAAGGGGINVGYGGTLIMRNTKIRNNEANDGAGGGILIPDSIGGDDPQKPGNVTIVGGEITGNKGDYAGGIYMVNAHGGGKLTIGGDLVVKDNIDTSASKKQRNIELTKGHKIYLTEQGLTSKAEVGVGTGETGEEVIIGEGSDNAVATQSALRMFADHKGSEEATVDDNLGIYTHSSGSYIYMGKNYKLELRSFRLTGEGRANVKVTIDNEKNTITAKFPFKEGYWNELWEAEWYAGKPGSATEGKAYTQGSSSGTQEHPLKSGTATRGDYEDVRSDYITLERNGVRKTWQIIFINEPGSVGKVIVENGSIKDKVAEKSSTDTKKIYYITSNEVVQLQADTIPKAVVFSHWEEGSEATTSASLDDWSSPDAKVTVPSANKTVHLKAVYTERKKVTVIGGTITNAGTQPVTEGWFDQGKEVQIKADVPAGKTFKRWAVIEGTANFASAEAKTAATTSFKMGDNSEKGKLEYTDVTIKAIYADEEDVQVPKCTKDSGTYNQTSLEAKLYLDPEDSSTDIYYRVKSNGNFEKYTKGTGINMSLGRYEKSEKFFIEAYSVKTIGSYSIKSDVVRWDYELVNPSLKQHRVEIEGGTIYRYGRDITVAYCWPGETVSINAISAMTSLFTDWEVVKGPADLLPGLSKYLVSTSFTMPNEDVKIVGNYSKTVVNVAAVNGTVNGKSAIQSSPGDKVKFNARYQYEKDGVKYTFSNWTIYADDVKVASSSRCAYKYTVPQAGNVVGVANYISENKHRLKVVNGTSSGAGQKSSSENYYFSGDQVTVKADKKDPMSSYEFSHWEVVSGHVDIIKGSLYKEELQIKMGSEDIVIKAVYEKPLLKTLYVINGKTRGGSVKGLFPTGYSVTVKANPDIAGVREFIGWTGVGIGVAAPTTRSWNFNMPDNNAVAIARFKDLRLTTINGVNREYDTTDEYVQSKLYEYQDKVEIKANVPSGYEFKEWVVKSAPKGFSIADKTAASTYVNMEPRGNVVLEATFTKKCCYSGDKCTISVNGGTAGKSGVAKAGDTLTVTADKIDGASLVRWEAVGVTLPSDVGTKSSFTLTMPDNDVSIKAVFTGDPTTLWTLNVEQGHIGDDVSRTCGVYGADTEITVTADNPAPEGMTGTYTFKEWQVVEGPSNLLDGKKTSETVTFKMPAQNVKLKAVYNYTVSGTVVHGYITKPAKLLASLGSSVETDLTPGETVRATASIASGMIFDHWDAYGIELTAEQKKTADINITVPQNDFVLVACYNESPVLKNSLYTENGTNVTKGSGDTPAASGNYASDVEVDIAAVNPDTTKYVFDGWEVVKAPAGFSIDKGQANQTIIMPNGDVELRAKFKAIKHNYTCVNCTVTIGGGAPTTSGSAEQGTWLQVTRTELEGASFDHWEVNGEKRTGSELTFSYKMPGRDVTIKAVYKPIIHELHTLVVNNGYIDGDVSKSVGTYGEGTKLTASAINPDTEFNSHYVFDKWEVVKGPGTLLDGQTANEIVSFTMPNQDVELKAVYTLRVNGYVVHGSLDKGSYGLIPGDTVVASAATASGMTFDHWDAYGVELTDDRKYAPVVSLTVPRTDFVLIACYNDTPVQANTLLTENGTNVAKGSGNTPDKIGTYAGGDEVEIAAVNPGAASGKADDYYFAGWEVVEAPDGFALDNKSATQTITMPNGDVVLRAVFKEYKYNVIGVNASVSLDNGATWSTFATAAKGAALKVKTEMDGILDHWEINGEKKLGTETAFDYTMPATDLIIKAIYKNERYIHNVVVDGGYIDNDPSSSIRTFGEGTEVTVTGINPTLDDGDKYYVFKEWQIVSGPSDLLDGKETSETVTFKMPGQYVELKAVYEPRVNGDIVRGVLSKTSKGLTPGESVTATAVAGSSMKFHHWSAIGFELPAESIYKDCITFDVPNNNFVLIACYEESPVQINTLLTENGTNKTKGGTETACTLGTYGSGTPVEITAVNPAKGTGAEDSFVFMCWEVVEAPDGFTIADPGLEQQTIIMPEGDVVLHAWYAEKHIALGVHALINDKEEGYYFEGDTLSVKADPGAGMEFAYWTVEGITLTKEQKQSEELELTMPDNDVTFIANYKKVDIPVHNLSLIHGTIEGYEGDEARSQDLYDGSTVIVKADPAVGLSFGYWYAEGITLTHEERISPELEITMPSDPGNDVRLTAVYYKDYPEPHKVTVVNGKITCENNKSDYFYEGSSVTVTADNKPGMVFKGWKAEGIELTEEQRLSENIEITMPDNDVTLTAEYAAKGGTDTGDSNNIVLYAGLVMLSIVGAAIAFVKRRRCQGDGFLDTH